MAWERKVSRTVRVRNEQTVGRLSHLLLAISDAGGAVGDIRMLSETSRHVVRDITIYTDDLGQFEAVLEAMRLNEGTVVTLAADSERKEVAALARAAGIMPTTTQARPGDPILSVIAPGERVLRTQAEIAALFPVTVPTQSPRPGGGARRSGGRKPAAKPGASAAGGRPGGGARGGRPQGSGSSRPSSGGSSARRGAPRPR